jgi:hypothetical protein
MDMRIDGTHAPEPQGLGDARLAGQAPKPSTSAADKTGVDSSQLLSEQAPYIRAAIAVPDADTSAVEEARNLLRSGQLDNPEAIQKAAQRILDLGI